VFSVVVVVVDVVVVVVAIVMTNRCFTQTFTFRDTFLVCEY